MDLRTRLDVILSPADTDFSSEAQDFIRDTFDMTLTTSDYLYVGFKKPVNALYAHITAANTLPATFTLEYFADDDTWQSLEFSDDTNAFQRSGFLTWERVDNSKATTVATKERHWVRISTSADLDPVTFQALNILFSDDNEIAQETPDIIDAAFYPVNQTSHILQHVAARNYIMSRLRSRGYVKYDGSSEKNITEWDVLDIYELRWAATYYAISQIYFHLSDNIEDQYWVKYEDYKQKFEESFNLGRLRIDQDNDGQTDAEEKRPVHSYRWNR